MFIFYSHRSGYKVPEKVYSITIVTSSEELWKFLSSLYTAEDYGAGKDNIEVLTGRKPTSFEGFVRREIPRYFN